MTCPTPHKRAYRKRTSAIAAAIRASRRLGPLRPYLCPCGRWHLSTKPKIPTTQGEAS